MAQLDLNQNHLNTLHPTNPWFAEELSGGGAVTRPYVDANQDKFDTEASMDTALAGFGYSATQLTRMTQNDKIFAIRLASGWVS